MAFGSAMPKWIKGLGLVLAFFAFLGLFYGTVNSLFGGGFYALWKDGGIAGWSSWHFVWLLPLLGAAGLLVEAVAEAIGSFFFAPFTWRHDDSPRKRMAYWGAVIIATCIALALVTTPWWLARLGGGNAI
jgi:hypothetical protein